MQLVYVLLFNTHSPLVPIFRGQYLPAFHSKQYDWPQVGRFQQKLVETVTVDFTNKMFAVFIFCALVENLMSSNF